MISIEPRPCYVPLSIATAGAALLGLATLIGFVIAHLIVMSIPSAFASWRQYRLHKLQRRVK